MKNGTRMIKDCEALQKLEHLTADNWHDMVEADARLVVAQLDSARSPTGMEVIRAAERLLLYAYWSRSSNIAAIALERRT